MKERAFQNVRVLASAAWGASMKGVEGGHLYEYKKSINETAVSRYNEGEAELKRKLLSHVSSSLDKEGYGKDDLLTLPWSSRRISLPRVTASLIAFTNDHGKKTTPEFFPADEIVTYLQTVRKEYENTGERVTIPDQFSLALSQTDNNPVAASLLTHGAYRAIGRGWDTRLSSKLVFPVDSDSEAITMSSVAESTADFNDSSQTKDPLGNTYHFWSQYTAGMVFSLLKRDKFIQTRLYNLAFSYGPEITSLIRERWRGEPLMFGDHKEIDMQGLRLGKATGHLILNKLSN